jgi:hypothetical protein
VFDLENRDSLSEEDESRAEERRKNGCCINSLRAIQIQRRHNNAREGRACVTFTAAVNLSPGSPPHDGMQQCV